jgi:hypothetical protein
MSNCSAMYTRCGERQGEAMVTAVAQACMARAKKQNTRRMHMDASIIYQRCADTVHPCCTIVVRWPSQQEHSAYHCLPPQGPDHEPQPVRVLSGVSKREQAGTRHSLTATSPCCCATSSSGDASPAGVNNTEPCALCNMQCS